MTKKLIGFISIWILIFSFFTTPVSGKDTGEKRFLMRYPDIAGDVVVFVYGGDIWKVSSTGGTAIKLTFNDGAELYPKISPNGKMIAFTGSYAII